ncbi:MAG: MgtE intracellular region [Synergistaceae bacterium]|jgi:flagellar motility protein MotE (MotC chaperone)|nr:MgtE intracellular region [Synergistaceae bacterium]
MADLQERNSRNDEPAAPDLQSPPEESKAGRKKKKKKKRGCGFFIATALLAAGVAAGLQASGGVDLRPYVYPVVPKVPYIGESLKNLLGIPDIYAMTASERRRIELEEWENEIAEAVRSLDQREQNLDAVSSDLAAMEQSLESQREELAERIEALSRDMGSGDAGPQGASQQTGIEETIRTFQDMSPRNAAAILEKLDDNLAVAILDGLPQDSRGNLLGRMDADVAAKLTEQLTELQRRRGRQRSQ